MKASTFAIALGFAGSLFNAVHAESFNQRGEDFIASVKPDSSVQRQPAGVLPGGFNDRGHGYDILTRADSGKAKPDTRLSFNGFNNRSHASFY